jgi:inhibitor of cysteine peptidase
LIVTLPGNPTTGYVWEELPGASGVLARQGDPDYTSDGRELGAGGYYRFTFLAVATGKVPLSMVYRRPFEQGLPPMATFNVSIDVFY